MSQRHVAEFLDSTFTGRRTAEDNWQLASTPLEIRAGVFSLLYIPSSNIVVNETRILASVDSPLGKLEFRVNGSELGDFVRVTLDGAPLVSKQISFTEGDQLTFTFNAIEGTITVAGADSGDGTATGTPWAVPDGPMRLGGDIEGDGYSARGFVSLPYAVEGAAEPDLTPTIDEVDPSVGMLAGGSEVAITGNYLHFATSVTFGGVAGTITAIADGEITVSSPASAVSGEVALVVTTPHGTVTGTFTYENMAAVTVDGITVTVDGDPVTAPE